MTCHKQLVASAAIGGGEGEAGKPRKNREFEANEAIK